MIGNYFIKKSSKSVQKWVRLKKRRLSYEHLVSAHSAGCIALPALVGIKSVMEQRNIYQSAKDELPIEIELPKRLR